MIDAPRKLRDEIEAVLRAGGNSWMAPEEIVDAIERRGRIIRWNRHRVTWKTICCQTRSYPNVFERNGLKARLRETDYRCPGERLTKAKAE